MVEKRSFERKRIEISSFYEWNGIKCPCSIVDITSEGIGLLVKGCLALGDTINLKLGNENITVSVVRVNGSNIGTRYKDIPENQLNYILNFEMQLSKQA